MIIVGANSNLDLDFVFLLEKNKSKIDLAILKLNCLASILIGSTLNAGILVLMSEF